MFKFNLENEQEENPLSEISENCSNNNKIVKNAEYNEENSNNLATHLTRENDTKEVSISN